MAGADEGAGAWAFGLVGGAIALVAALPLVAFGVAAPLPAATAALALLALVTGITHLDGLADTADALAAPNPSAAERARTDPRLGAGGATALFLLLALDVGLLGQLATSTGPAVIAGVLLAAGGVSRAVPVILALVGRRRLDPSGLAGWFGAQVGARVAGIATLTGVVPALAWALVVGMPGPVVASVLGGFCGVPAALLVAQRRGRIDGDLLGASIELSFACALTGAVAAIAAGGPGSPG